MSWLFLSKFRFPRFEKVGKGQYGMVFPEKGVFDSDVAYNALRELSSREEVFFLEGEYQIINGESKCVWTPMYTSINRGVYGSSKTFRVNGTTFDLKCSPLCCYWDLFIVAE